MKKKILAAVMAGFMTMTVMTAGVAAEAAEAQTEEAAQEDAEATQEDAEAEEPEEEIKVLGTKTKDCFEVKMKNCTTRLITGVAVKKLEDTQFSDNLLEEEELFDRDETRILYYNPDPDAEPVDETEEATEEEAEEAAETVDEEAAEAADAEAAADADEMLTYEGYDIQITFQEDGANLVLHSFPFEDMTECELYAEDGVVFLRYESLATGEAVDTKEAQISIMLEEQAAAAAAQEAQKAQQAAAQSSSGQTYQEPVYEEPVYEEPVYQEPVYEEPVYEEPAPAEPSGGDDVCLDGGLVY